MHTYIWGIYEQGRRNNEGIMKPGVVRITGYFRAGSAKNMEGLSCYDVGNAESYGPGDN